MNGLFHPILEALEYAFCAVFPYFLVVLFIGITFIILKHVYFWIRDVMVSNTKKD